MIPLDEARGVAARHLEAARQDLGRLIGRPPRPGFWLLLVAGAAFGFRAADAIARGSRGARRQPR